MLDDLAKGVELLADKGYASKANRAELNHRDLKDGIMHKAVRGRPIRVEQQQRNNEIKTKRWAIEQTFGTLKADLHSLRRNTLGKVKS